MTLPQTHELTDRFGETAAKLMADAYEAVLASNAIGCEERFALIEALIGEVEAGHCEPDHLREVAEIFVPPGRVEGLRHR